MRISKNYFIFALVALSIIVFFIYTPNEEEVPIPLPFTPEISISIPEDLEPAPIPEEPKKEPKPVPPLVVIVPPPVILPVSVGLGRHFFDADFGTELIQVTDEKDGKSCVNLYSYWLSFNTDSTKFFIMCDDVPWLYHFNPNDFSILSKEPLKASSGLLFDDSLWSDKTSHILFARSGTAIWAYDTILHTKTLLKDFSSLLPGAFIFQMSKSVDDNRFAFTIKDPAQDYKVTSYAVWDRAQNRIIYKEDTSELDEVQLDKSGKFLVVKTGRESAGEVRIKIVNLSTLAATDLTAGAPDFAPGHSDNGDKEILGYDNWNNQYTLTNLATLDKKVILNLKNDWTQASHISLLGSSGEWALISLFSTGGNALLFPGEIILVATDGSGTVKHIARHYSVYREYWDAPRANMSRDGRFAVFTSNWGSLEHRDVYIARLP